MDPNCIFCKIIIGSSPSSIVFQDEQAVAFLDIHPASPVHILIVPRQHIESINDLDDEHEALIGHLFTVARDLAAEKGISESGYRLIVNSGQDARQAVFHLHLHLLGGASMRYPMG
jgi:histidine triad (HIT) family protein